METQWRDATAAWLIREALAGSDESVLVSGICERLEAQGHRPLRGFLASNVLDPVIGGRGVRWQRGTDLSHDQYERRIYSESNGDWVGSPFYAMLRTRVLRLRRRLDDGYRRGEFALLDRFQDEGATEYVAYLTFVGSTLHMGEFQGFAFSLTTDHPDGFTDETVEQVGSLCEPLGLAVTMNVSQRIARSMLTTYLGRDVAAEVLAGNVDRGRARSIRAVIWYSDLAGFTRIADTHDAQATLEFLNAYAEVLVEAIEGRGGQVLKFIGDGMLAIFHADATAHGRALEAAAIARRELVALETRRTQAGLPVSRWHVAIHDGEVLFGNFGSARRLDFTVLGAAVNEAARMEALGRTLEQQIVVSEAFAAACGPLRAMLVRLGRYALKGIARPQELYTVEPD